MDRRSESAHQDTAGRVSGWTEVQLTQEEGHGLREGGEEHAGGHLAQDAADLLVQLLLGQTLVPLLGNTDEDQRSELVRQVPPTAWEETLGEGCT